MKLYEIDTLRKNSPSSAGLTLQHGGTVVPLPWRHVATRVKVDEQQVGLL